MKTFFDFFFSLIGLLLSAPFLLIICLLILLIDHQNPFFYQPRLGKNKTTFQIIKLRTMKNNTITSFGKVLRRTGIDEIPQLVNILFGKMSFVGPRPLTDYDVKRLEWDGEYYAKRWNIKPGIIGLAQLSPICNKRASWMLDNKYLEHQSFKLDIKLIVHSFSIIFKGKTKVQNAFFKRS